MLPLGADMVIARTGLVFNPHYKSMGLYGSEYWTYSLPKRVGQGLAEKLTSECKPISSKAAEQIGLVDKVVEGRCCDVLRSTLGEARSMALRYEYLLAKKRHALQAEEGLKPLIAYREEELQHMNDNLFKDSLGFARKRADFVQKTGMSFAPNRIAKHRISSGRLSPRALISDVPSPTRNQLSVAASLQELARVQAGLEKQVEAKVM